MICSDIWHKYHLRYFKIVSNFTRLTAREILNNSFEISLVVFMPNITTNHAITYTNSTKYHRKRWRGGSRGPPRPHPINPPILFKEWRLLRYTAWCYFYVYFMWTIRRPMACSCFFGRKCLKFKMLSLPFDDFDYMRIFKEVKENKTKT